MKVYKSVVFLSVILNQAYGMEEGKKEKERERHIVFCGDKTFQEIIKYTFPNNQFKKNDQTLTTETEQKNNFITIVQYSNKELVKITNKKDERINEKEKNCCKIF